MSITPYDDGNFVSRRKDRLDARQASDKLVRHSRNASVKARIEQIDVTVGADAVRGCLDEELDLLQYGQYRAGNSKKARELVDRKVSRFAARNDLRLMEKGF